MEVEGRRNHDRSSQKEGRGQSREVFGVKCYHRFSTKNLRGPACFSCRRIIADLGKSRPSPAPGLQALRRHCQC